MTTQIQLRRDTAANWGSVDPVLADGEIGYDTTSSQFKVGNGVDSWSALSFSSGGASSWDELQGKPTDFPPSAHGHEEITKSEDGQPTAYIRYADDTWKASPGLEVEGDITVSGDATIGGGVEIDGDLSLGGKFEGDLTVSGNINIEGGTINAPDGSSYLTEAPADGNQYARQDNAWSEVVIPDVDLTGYATEVYVDDAIAAIPAPNVIWEQNGDDIYYSDGKVGIGVNDPQKNLTVKGVNGRRISFGESGTPNVSQMRVHTDNDTSFGYMDYAAYSHTFSTGTVATGTERLKISESGRVEITGSLYVNGSEVGSGGGGLPDGDYTHNGKITATDFISTSDERLKENITPMPIGLIDDIKPVSWDWKDGSGPSAGVVAQQLQSVGLGDYVIEDEDGQLGVNYQALTAILLAEVIELKRRLK